MCSRDFSASSQKKQAEGVITNFVKEDIRSKTSFEKFISKFAQFSAQGNLTWLAEYSSKSNSSETN